MAQTVRQANFLSARCLEAILGAGMTERIPQKPEPFRTERNLLAIKGTPLSWVVCRSCRGLLSSRRVLWPVNHFGGTKSL